MNKLRKKFGKRTKYNYKRTFVGLFLFLLVLGIGIAYATLTTNLSINGTSHVKSSRWDVHFENVQELPANVTATTKPTITNDTTINFGVTLEKPGDYYCFTVDLVNAGTLDARLSEITITPELTTDQESYFYYDAYYFDYTDLNEGDALSAGEMETIFIAVGYIEQDDITLYPSDDVYFDFSVTLNYEQGKGTQLHNYVYSTSFHQIQIGDQIVPGSAIISDNYNDVVESFDAPIFTRLLLGKENEVLENYVGFIKDNVPYYLSGSFIIPRKEANKVLLTRVFGNDLCEEYTFEGETYFNCADESFSINLNMNTGEILATHFPDHKYCGIDDNWYSRCGDGLE